jgi:uroporphyrinogen-III synthase
MGDLSGSRVALLEARMSSELASLVRKHGGEPVCAPAVREEPVGGRDEVSAMLDALHDESEPVFVLSTGVGVNALFREADALGRRDELRSLLERSTTVCRGPKPTAALKKEGLTPKIRAEEPFTTADLLAALEGVPAVGRWVVLHYGERNDALLERLSARGIAPIELLLYVWQLPEDTRPLEALVGEIIAGGIRAVVFTSKVQVRHLFQIAAERQGALKEAMNARTIVAAVGPTCASELESMGVVPKVVPEHPKMGPMMLALVEYVNAQR